MWTMYCSTVRVICFWCEDGLGMCDFMQNDLAVTVFLLLVVLLSIDGGVGLAVLDWLHIFYGLGWWMVLECVIFS